MGREDEIIKERIKKIDELKKLGINPYVHKFDRKDSTKALHEEYDKKLKAEQKGSHNAKIAGRLMSYRDLGKIAFGVLQDGSGRIQIVVQDPETPKEVRDFTKKFIDVGDFIGVEGTIMKTKTGELSILANHIDLLSKSILPLPDKFHGLQNDEERLRKRYLEIITNPETKELFIRKAKFWQTMRSFLIEQGFLEVETPVLETAAGGASATPFKTHHNALDMDVYLRISMGELWQKKLMVAGYEKTFEIGRQFRNEGMDADHLQDYSQMEFYWAYADFEDGMALVKEMYRKIAKDVYSTTKFERAGHKFDLAKEWDIIDYSTEIKKQTKLNIFTANKEEITAKLREIKEDFKPNQDYWSLVDTLWKHCRRNISGPAFLTGQPVEVSPLAKRSRKDHRKVERFQIILAGSEVGNGYSELNDPFDQEERFKEQKKLKEAGDTEAQEHDEAFIEALKHGMPPTCGFGVSERLFAFLEGKPIRETVIFPLMRPTISESEKQKEKKEDKE